jgi:hypothetical protein
MIHYGMTCSEKTVRITVCAHHKKVLPLRSLFRGLGLQLSAPCKKRGCVFGRARPRKKPYAKQRLWLSVGCVLGRGATARTAHSGTDARTDRGTPRGPRSMQSMHRQSNAQRPPWQRLRLNAAAAGAPALRPQPQHSAWLARLRVRRCFTTFLLLLLRN